MVKRRKVYGAISDDKKYDEIFIENLKIDEFGNLRGKIS